MDSTCGIREFEEIENLKAKGYTHREIADRNEFSFEALKLCNLPISYLVPKIYGQDIWMIFRHGTLQRT